GDHPEILADHERPGAAALERQDPDELGEGLPQVGAVARRRSLGNPELPAEPHHVVDAQHAAVSEGAAQEPAPGAKAIRAQAERIEGHEPPALPPVRVGVGRGPEADRSRVEPRARPDVARLEGIAEREIAVEPDRHARTAGRFLAGAELLLELELEVRVQVDLPRARRGEGGYRGAARVAVRLGPATPVGVARILRDELLAQRAEDRPVAKLLPLAPAVGRVGARERAIAVAMPEEEGLVHPLERAALRRERPRVVDAVRSGELRGRRAGASVPLRAAHAGERPPDVEVDGAAIQAA